MIKLEKNKSKGLVIWLIGLPGSGKTSIAKKIKKKFSRDFGPTIVMSGDDLRKIYGLKKYAFFLNNMVGVYPFATSRRACKKTLFLKLWLFMGSVGTPSGTPTMKKKEEKLYKSKIK